MFVIDNVSSVVKARKKCNLNTLLEECKYEIKKTKMENLINDDLEPSSTNDETDSETIQGSESKNEQFAN